MNRTKRINNILKKNLLEFGINVIDDSHSHIGHKGFDGVGETHIIVELKNNNNLKVNRLEIHKKINSFLSEEFKNGLHALQIKII